MGISSPVYLVPIGGGVYKLSLGNTLEVNTGSTTMPVFKGLAAAGSEPAKLVLQNPDNAKPYLSVTHRDNDYFSVEVGNDSNAGAGSVEKVLAMNNGGNLYNKDNHFYVVGGGTQVPMILTGTLQVNNYTFVSGQNAQWTIPFGYTFPGPPRVYVEWEGNKPANNQMACTIQYDSITPTEFKYNIGLNENVTHTFRLHWLAVYNQ